MLRNIGACRLKETDRAKSIKEELIKMGARLEETEDTLTVYRSRLHGTHISGHNDHRIVMAMSVAGLAAEGETVIDTAECSAVSFPNFFEVMTSIGADIIRR